MKKFIIIILVVAIGVFGYSFYKKNIVSADSPLQSSTGAVQTSATPAEGTISGEDDEINRLFLTTLLSLKKITLDRGIFGDAGFMSLEDYTTQIKRTDPQGRPNPFSNIGTDAEIGVSGGNSTFDGSTFGTPSSGGGTDGGDLVEPTEPTQPSLGITTGSPDKVTASSAVLMGVLSPNIKPTLRWFAYGNSSSLGHRSVNIPATSPFALTLSGLVSGRAYYYQACMQAASGDPVCADVVSFTTL